MQVRTIAFTGHRPDKLGGYSTLNPVAKRVLDRLDRVIRAAVAHNGTRVFITGMALGVDQWAAELVIQFRRDLELALDPLAEEIKLVAAVPMVSQALRWPLQSQNRWWEILDECDEIYVQGQLMGMQTLLDEVRRQEAGLQLGKQTAARLLNQRNEFMVNMADGVLAVWDGSKGGTANCVAYAQKVGKPVTVIDPTTLQMRRL